MDKEYLDSKLKDSSCRLMGVMNTMEHRPMKMIFMSKRIQGVIDLLTEVRKRLEKDGIVD